MDLDFINQLGTWDVSFALVFTKSDKSTVKEAANNVNQFLARMQETWEEPPVYFVTSAVKRTGTKAMLAFIAEMNKQWEERNEQKPGF